MKKVSKFITNHSFLIVLLSVLLLIPATIGYDKYQSKLWYFSIPTKRHRNNKRTRHPNRWIWYRSLFIRNSR